MDPLQQTHAALLAAEHNLIKQSKLTMLDIIKHQWQPMLGLVGGGLLGGIPGMVTGDPLLHIGGMGAGAALGGGIGGYMMNKGMPGKLKKQKSQITAKKEEEQTEEDRANLEYINSLSAKERGEVE